MNEITRAHKVRPTTQVAEAVVVAANERLSALLMPSLAPTLADLRIE